MIELIFFCLCKIWYNAGTQNPVGFICHREAGSCWSRSHASPPLIPQDGGPHFSASSFGSLSHPPLFSNLITFWGLLHYYMSCIHFENRKNKHRTIRGSFSTCNRSNLAAFAASKNYWRSENLGNSLGTM